MREIQFNSHRNNLLTTFSDRPFRAKKKIGRSNSQYQKRFETDLADAVESQAIKKRVNIENGKVNTNQPLPKSSTKAVNPTKQAGKVGKFISKNKILLGVAGAGALGVAGTKLIRKMRSDKGKKRRRYFNGG